MRTYRIVFRPWRLRRVLYWLFPLELLGTIAMLVLTGISQPNAYRTALWRIGYDYGFNSNPAVVLYAYANHVAQPHIPFVWSQSLTDFNVAISVLALFVLLAKLIATIMHVYYPVLGTFVAVTMTALFATSAGGQAGPDYSDSRYPSPVAWYIAKSCKYARSYGYYSDCLQAKGSFAATIFMLTLYVVNIGLAVNSMRPNKALDVPDSYDSDDEAPTDKRQQRKMQPRSLLVHNAVFPPQSPYTPYTPFTPFTPRTQAFQTLDRKLPLRSN